MTSRAIHHWFYIFSEIAACWFWCVDNGWQDESGASAVVFFLSGCCIFPLFRISDSLILERPSRINYVASQFKLQRMLGLARVSPLWAASINMFPGREHFLFLFTFTRLQCCTSTEEAHAHMSTNRLVPDEHCVLWDLPCSLKIQQQGKEKKQQMRPSSLFIFSIEFSQSNSKPPQSVRWCGVSFCTRPELHFRGSQSADGWKWRIYYNMGSRRTWNISCYVLHPLQPGKTQRSQNPFVRICDPMTQFREIDLEFLMQILKSMQLLYQLEPADLWEGPVHVKLSPLLGLSGLLNGRNML